LSTHTKESAGLAGIGYFLHGSSLLPYDPSPTFGLVATASQHAEGDIVVTAAARHADMSITYRFATVDPFTHQPVTWAENLTFLDMGRANADVNVIRFDLAANELPLTPQEEEGLLALRSAVQDTIASLRQLDPNGYFQVEGWGQIRVAEMINLLMRSDWEIHPSNSFQGGHPIGDVVRNGGDPELRLNRSWLPGLAVDPLLLYFYIMHEITHVTRSGWDHRQDANREIATNDVTAAVLARIGKVVDSRNQFGSTIVTYNPNIPVT
jgi:hypothetical protein